MEGSGQFVKQLKELFSNKDMMILVLLFGQMLGTSNTVGTIIGEVAPDLGYSANYASVFGALFIVGGSIGCAAFGVVVEKHQCYKKAVIVSCFFATVFCAASWIVMPRTIGWLMCVVCFCLGLFLFPIMVIALDFGVELTYPVGESMSVGVLMSSG